MTINTISTLPTAPARTDAPATFVTRADAFLAALVVMQGELNTSIGQMNTDIAGVNANAIAAAASASSAASSATAAANAAGAALWVSGQAYAEGDAAISLVNYQTYRAETATSGTTDPSLDANWTAISGTFPSQTGNADKFLTTDGTNPSWANLPASAGSADFVATGAIGNGDTVGLRSDGTVEVISGTQVFELYSGTVTNKAAATFREVKAVYDSVNNKIYAKWNEPTAVYVNVGTVTGTTITWGADQFVTGNKYSNSYGDSGITYDAVADRVIVFYQDASNLPTFVAGVVTGNTIGFGTPASLSGVNFQEQQGFSFAYDTEHNTWHFSFENSSNGLPTIVPFTISGTTITLGSKFDINIYTTNGVSCAYSESQNKIVCGAWSTSTSVHFYVLDYDGSNYTEEDFEFFNPVQSGISNSYAAWDESTQTFVLIGSKSDNTDVVCAQLVGGQIVIGNYLQGIFNSSYFVAMSIVYSEGKFWIAGIQNGGSYKLYLAEATISSNVISVTLGGFYHDVLTGGYQLNLVADENGIVHTLYGDTGFTEYRHVAFRKASLNTNADSYIGLATAAISDGATGTINILGGTNASQSGLTVGGDYWLNLDGTLSTTKTNYAKIGYATAADTIVLSANSNESTAINSGGLYLTAGTTLTEGQLTFYGSGQAQGLIVDPISPPSSISITSGVDGAVDDTCNTPAKLITGGGKAVLFARNGSNYIRAYPFTKNTSGQWVVGNTSTVYSGSTYTGAQNFDGVYNPLTGAYWLVFSDTSWYMRVIGCLVVGTGASAYIGSVTQTSVSAGGGGVTHCMGIDTATGRIVVTGHSNNYSNMWWSGFYNTSGTSRTNTDFDNNFTGAQNCSRGMRLHYLSEYDEWMFISQNASNQFVFATINYDSGTGTSAYKGVFSAPSDAWSDDNLDSIWSTYHQVFFVKQVYSTSRTWLRVFTYISGNIALSQNFDIYALSGNNATLSSYNAYKRPEVIDPYGNSQVAFYNAGTLHFFDYDGSSTLTYSGNKSGYQVTSNNASSFDKASYDFDVFTYSGTTVYPRASSIAVTNWQSFIGFANHGANTGELVKIDSTSSINNKQTDLIAGTTYYIDSTGSLSTSETTVGAGRALSSTEILVNT